LPFAGGVLGAVGGSAMGGAFGGAMGSSLGTAGGKALADDIIKRGYGVRGRKKLVRPASDMTTLSPYDTSYSPQNHPFTPRYSFQNGGTGEQPVHHL
jgi:hypothetical protein